MVSGGIFYYKNDFKEEITSYSVQSGKNLRYTKNDKIRVKVRCKDGCEWDDYCAKLYNEDY